MRLVDLSHTVSDGLVTYPGLPAPVISEHLTFDASHEVYAEGTEFSIGRIERAAGELARELERRAPATVADPFALTEDFEDMLKSL